MLVLAAALQHLSPHEMIPGLTEHHHIIMERLAESAIALVTVNDALLGTLESLEVVILEGLYHVDRGNIRRGWVTMRRAVMAAQLMSLHRPGHYRFKSISDQSDLDPEAMWTCIVSLERVLSLLLGLPTSTSAMSPTVEEATSASAQGSNIHLLLLDVTAKILERNQIHVPQKSLEVTREIDREIVKLTGQMPSTFWQPPAFAGIETNSAKALQETQRIWGHICYYTLVSQLHLPYMLCPSNTPQSTYSKIACVNASREILIRHIAIVTFNPIFPCRRMADFMALVAGMTLTLAHIVSHCQKEMDNLLVHQRPGDRATVERTLECMKSMSELREDVLAAKCAVLLRGLLAVEADAAQGQSYRAHKFQPMGGDHEDDRNVLIITVPYLGAIRIAREGITSVTPLQIAQSCGLQEDVTLGGIGSLHVSSPKVADYSYRNSTSSVAATQASVTQAVDVSSSQQHATYIPPAASGAFTVPQDQFYPDAAASIDDWAFQGFDTAFFDVLMHGAGDEHTNGIGVEDWDSSTFR